MLGRILLPSVFLVLAYGFWVSSSFKDVSAGVALFLFGMLCMEQGFKAYSGGALQRLLAASTDRLWKSLTFGIVSTTLMQSSSLVSVVGVTDLTRVTQSIVARTYRRRVEIAQILNGGFNIVISLHIMGAVYVFPAGCCVWPDEQLKPLHKPIIA